MSAIPEPVVPIRLAPSRPDPARGVFETFLVQKGDLVELDSHFSRLEASLSTLYGELAPEDALRLVLDGARGIRIGRLRLTVAPSAQGALVCDVRGVPVDEAMVFPKWEHAVRLKPFVVPGGLGEHKWADRARLEQADKLSNGAVPLILEAQNGVLEASRGNLFVVQGSTILTPTTDGRILPGVTRRRVLELSDELGLDAREQPVSVDDLLRADEAFLTGAVRGIEPVCTLELLREWHEGQITSLLSQALERAWLSEA